MYGQAGIILGGPRRRARPFSPGCSPGSSRSASGGGRPRHGPWPGSSATAGTSSSSGRCGPVGSFSDKAFHEVLAGIDNRTTLLLDHTRRRTRAAAGGAGARGRPLSGSTSSLPITLENARHPGMGRLAQELAPPHPPGCPSVRQPRRTCHLGTREPGPASLLNRARTYPIRGPGRRAEGGLGRV